MRINTIDAQKGYYLQPQKSRNDVSFGTIQTGKEELIKKIVKPSLEHYWELAKSTKAYVFMIEEPTNRVYVQRVDKFIGNSPDANGYDFLWKIDGRKAQNLEKEGNFDSFMMGVQGIEGPQIQEAAKTTSNKITKAQEAGTMAANIGYKID